MNLWDYVKLNRDKLMNVSDLISELSKLDGTLPVLIQIDDVGATPIKTVGIPVESRSLTFYGFFFA